MIDGDDIKKLALSLRRVPSFYGRFKGFSSVHSTNDTSFRFTLGLRKLVHDAITVAAKRIFAVFQATCKLDELPGRFILHEVSRPWSWNWCFAAIIRQFYVNGWHCVELWEGSGGNVALENIDDEVSLSDSRCCFPGERFCCRRTPTYDSA